MRGQGGRIAVEARGAGAPDRSGLDARFPPGEDDTAFDQLKVNSEIMRGEMCGKCDIPFLLVDYADPMARVMLIHRADIEVRFALLSSFSQDEAFELTRLLKNQGRGMRFGCNGPFLINQLKGRLELAF